MEYYKYTTSLFWGQPEYNQRTQYAGFIPGWRQNTLAEYLCISLGGVELHPTPT